MRRSFYYLTIAATLATIFGWGGTGRAQTFEWEYSVDGGAFVVRNLIFGSNSATSATDSVSPLSDLTITVSATSNNPGASAGAELFNATTDTVNTSGTTHTVIVEVTETSYTAPTGAGNLNASVGSVTVQRTSSFAGTATATFSNVYAALAGSNSPFDTGGFVTNTYGPQTLTTSAGSVNGPNANLTSASNPFTPTKPFSMTLVDPITLGNNTSATLKLDATFTPSNVTSTTPEPSTLAIAGLGALGMIGYGLRRRKALGA